jgi:glyoxylase-like metal-dependent hydrolase (beta-lactamase superfamily II)
MKIGQFTARAINAGTFKLDGGAMFGVVPKVLWKKTNPADENNRIDMTMRVLYLEGGGRRMVVDSGAGIKLDKKMKRNYVINAIELSAALTESGIDPSSITDAVATHLHFDHGGGFTAPGPDGALRLALPEAVHYIQKKQWEAAHNPNAKDRASFLPENFELIGESGHLELVDGDTEIFPGVRLMRTDGHTPGHQIVLVSDGGSNLLYCADLIPLASHINIPYIMAYDHEPLKTLEEKKAILERAADEGWILFFEHDPEISACRIVKNDKGRFEISEIIDPG